MDNKIFNVNGGEDDLLVQALSLAFRQNGRGTKAVAWKCSEEHGMILFWTESNLPVGANKFMSPLDAVQCANEVIAWLKTEQAEGFNINYSWDMDQDHDGHNSKGWRVYKEDWGHVGGMWQAICAIRPAYMWHGK